MIFRRRASTPSAVRVADALPGGVPDNLRLAIFDFDGTLADSFGWFAHTLRTLAPRYRLCALDDAGWDALRGLDARTIMRRLGLSWWTLPRMTREVRRRMHAEIGCIARFDGVDALFAALDAAGVRIAIVTSNSEANVRAVLGPDLCARVAVLECDVALFGKPRRLRRAMRRAEVPPARTVYIGDEIRDAEAARRAGVGFVGVGWGYTRADALSAMCRHPVCPDPEQLRGTLVGD